MKDEVHIKTLDLCERCFYGNSKCNLGDCRECEVRIKDTILKCGCLSIKFNTPCPYFKNIDS